MQLVTIGLLTFLTTDFILPDHARVLSLTLRGIVASIAASGSAVFFATEFTYFELLYNISILVVFFILIGNIKWISKKIRIARGMKKPEHQKEGFPVYFQVDSKDYFTSMTDSLEAKSHDFLRENSHYITPLGN